MSNRTNGNQVYIMVIRNKTAQEFRDWIESKYKCLWHTKSAKSSSKAIAVFSDKGVIRRVYAGKPSAYVNKFWDWKIENGMNPGQVSGNYREQIDIVTAVGYASYIKSRAWLIKSSLNIRHHNSECEVCASSISLHSHHYNYKRLGHEKESDLFCLCEKCHDLYHYVYPSDKLPKDTDFPRGNRLLHIIQGIQKAKRKIKEDA